MQPDIYSYITTEESKFGSDEVQLGDNWWWNFRKHVQLIFHLKNGVFYTGENNWLRAFKQIMRPLLRLSYWTEDLEVKDVTFFIENSSGKVLSFFIKKYYDEVYTREHDLDTLFDEITESDIDYGGALVQRGVEMPEVLPLNSIAFCDQTDMQGGPIFFKHYFSPDKLKGMEKFGWGEEKNGATVTLEELCTLATAEKDAAGTTNDNKNKLPGKTIEVYIGRGNLPESYLYEDGDTDYACNQVQIVAFYTDADNNRQGVTLYRKKEHEGNIKFHASEKIYNRALGYSDGEAFLHPQIWTNFLTIHKTSMLEAASKVPLVTDDPTYTQKNKIQDMENLEITTIEDGKKISQVPTAAPANIQLFQNEINSWYEHSQFLGAAYDPLLGKESSSGTTFRGQERLVAQGKGWHDRRRGQRAKFIEEIHRDWIIPDIKKEILKGKKFLATLTMDEMMWISDQLATNYANRKVKDLVLKGKKVTKQEQDLIIQTFKQDFSKKGDKHLLEILEDEFKDVEIKIGINVAGKQKDLVTLSDKLLSIFQSVFQNPSGFQQAMQIPALAKSFENILEFGGMSIGDFSTLLQAPAQPVPSPIQPDQAPRLAVSSQQP